MLSDTFITESYCDALYPNPERLGRALVLDGWEHVVGVDCIKSREHGTCFMFQNIKYKNEIANANAKGRSSSSQKEMTKELL